MASDNLMMALEQPWQFRPTFADAWLSDTFENECLTKALHKSFTTNTTTTTSNDAVFTDLVDSLLNQPPVHTPTISGASENEFPAPKRRRSLPPTGRVAKRKSRASKRSTTTFITADPANFRQMVQQVTGVRLNRETPVVSVLKPEPHRAADQRVQVGLDASFLLDSASFLMNGAVQPTTMAVADGGASGFGFDSFCSFPTLESWKV